jgi:hypothetical protein
MNDESTPLRLRVLRIIDHRDGNWSRWIVIEDVAQSRFRSGVYSSGAAPPIGWKARMDRGDAWSALKSLRQLGRNPQQTGKHWSTARSIDALISQEEIEMLQSWEEVGLGQRDRKEPPSFAPKYEAPPAGPPEPIVMLAPECEGRSEKEIRMTEEVWAYAGGKRWTWKPLGTTPAGRECEVLTFSGSEEVSVGPKSIEIPTQTI